MQTICLKCLHKEPGRRYSRAAWVGRERLTLGTHPWIVTTVAVSPDGRWVASGSMDRPGDGGQTLKPWDLSADLHPAPRDPWEPEPDRTLAATGTVWWVGFTEDSRTLVSGGVRGVRIWDIASGRARTDLPTLAGQEVAVAGHQAVGSPKHPFFSNQKAEPLWVLDLHTGRHRTLKAVGRHPALSPDGRRLVHLEGGSLQLMDLASHTIVLTAATHRLVFRLKFSPDGRRILASGQMTSGRIWELDRPKAATWFPGARIARSGSGQHPFPRVRSWCPIGAIQPRSSPAMENGSWASPDPMPPIVGPSGGPEPEPSPDPSP